MNIVFLDSYTLNPGDLKWELLNSLGSVTYYANTSPEEIIQRSIDAQIIISNKVKLDAAVFSQLPDLQCICVAATGYNNIDIEAAKSHNIRVMNVSGYSTPAVAQHVFALLFGLIHKVESYANEVQHRWPNQINFSYWDQPIRELYNKTMGIYGLGKIGQAVARIALAFGMKVIAVHKHPERDKMEGVQFVDASTFFKNADFITLHTPLTPQTHHLINSNTLQLMKPSALIINTGRGDLIDEIALLKALQNNVIAGAGLDVLSVEPPSTDHPLFQAPNCLITPHQAWASQESRQRLLNEICENIKAFQKGEERNLIC